MALMAEPSLLVMDEPTTGLDVTVEAAVLDLVRDLRRKHNSAHRLHQPQSRHGGAGLRPHRRDVCRRAGGGGADRRRCSASRAIPIPAACWTASRCSAPTSAPRRWCRFPGQVPPALHRPAGCIFASRCKHADHGALHGRPHPDRRRCAGEAAHRVQCVRAHELPVWQRPQIAGAQAAAAAARREDSARRREPAGSSTTPSTSIFSGAESYEVKALQRRQHVRQARHDAGHRRRIRLRQVDLRQGAHRPREGDRRQGRGSMGSDIGMHRASRIARSDVKGKLQMVFQNPGQHAQSQPFRRLRHRARRCGG